MHYNIIKTAAGARTRLRLPMVWKADAVAAEKLPEAVFWVFIGGNRVRVEKTPGSDDEYIFPALQAGQYAWDLVVDAQVVLHGVLKVRGSAVPPGGGEVCGTLLVDAPAMVLVLSPGPRGEVGPVGPQGLSAYEVALQHGYEGSEDEWAEELSGAQAAATAAKEQATAAAGSAKAAAGSATTAGEQASAAADSAKAAASSATTAGEQARAAEQSARDASTSANSAEAQARAAEGSAKAAADTLAAAPKLNGNNSFSGTNTFNGMLAANGGITGLPAPTGWSNPPNLHDGLLSAFTGGVTSRRILCKNTLISAGGTLSDTGLLSSPANECAVVKGSFSPMFAFGSYSNLSSLWLPVQMRNVDGSRCRLLLMLQDRLSEPHYKLRQTENIDETFYYYSQETLTSIQHFAVAEILISISDNKQTVDLWSYEGVATGQPLTTVKKTSCTLATVLSTNYVGIIGFLFVRTSADEMKVFAVTFSGYLRITLVGSVFTRAGVLLILATSQRALYTAVQGGTGGAGSCMVADALELQLNWSPDFYYPGAISILQAATPQLSTTLYSIGADGSLSELTQ